MALIVVWTQLGSSAFGQTQEARLGKLFKGTTAAFAFYDLREARYIRFNPSRCEERFSPKSTFKIPNSLIGLETGVIKDAEFVIPWDRRKYPPQHNWTQEPFVHWASDHTLRSAIKYSVVWYYRELALRVGAKEMNRYVSAFAYGNRVVSGPIDDFWLNGSLKISANEQLEFLKRFYTGRLPVSARSLEIVKDILVLERTATSTLSGKTGGGPIRDGVYIGWFVGFLESGDRTYLFAVNIEGSTFDEVRSKRFDLAKKALVELGYLENR